MNREIKSLPMVALRGMTIMPEMVVHFDVSREKSIAAIQEAMEGDQKIFLVAQRSIETDDPTQEDVYEVGTVGTIKQIMKLPKHIVRVLVSGETRGILKQLQQDTPYLRAEVEVIDESDLVIQDDLNGEAMARSLKDTFLDYAARNGKMSKEAVAEILEIKSLKKLVDEIAANTPFYYVDQQEILGKVDFWERYETLAFKLVNEVQIMDIKDELQQKVKERVDKHQKEYILREQLKLIREELGDDSTLSDAEEFEKAAKNLKAPKEVNEKLKKEISRFKSSLNSPAESGVIRTYIETLLEMPWDKAGKDNQDIKYAEEVLEADHYGLEQVKERIAQLMQQINEAQGRITEATAQRSRLSDEIVDINEDLKSASLMKHRYQILRGQYHSDIKRITFIIDGEQKLSKEKEPEHCPFCGAEMEVQRSVEYAEAAQAELQRILPQLNDVMDAEKDIDQEIAEHKKRIQECDEESSRLAQLINQDLQPTIQELQNQIEMLQESVDSASQQGIIEKIEKHITTPKKTEDGNEDQAAFKAQDNFTAEFVSDFNDLLNTILTEVKFDKFSNCYFDFESEDFDIVVNGKKKQKFGGGYKAFLNATVAIALHQYLSEKGKHGLGILLMDSPILSLKEGGSDTSAEMRNGLFEYLVKNQDFGQVIIVENSIPTIDYDGAKREMYTHKEGDGRYGLLIGYTE